MWWMTIVLGNSFTLLCLEKSDQLKNYENCLENSSKKLPDFCAYSSTHFQYQRETMCTQSIRNRVLINTVDWYPWSTSGSTLNQHPNQYSINSWSTVNTSIVSQMLTDSYASLKKYHSPLMTDCWPRCWRSTYQAPIEGWSINHAFSTCDPERVYNVRKNLLANLMLKIFESAAKPLISH